MILRAEQIPAAPAPTTQIRNFTEEFWSNFAVKSIDQRAKNTEDFFLQERKSDRSLELKGELINEKVIGKGEISPIEVI